MPSLLELQDLYTESLTREIIEKTKGGGIVWNHVGGTQFSATQVQPPECDEGAETAWGFYLTKTQIGNLSYKYSLDIKKDGVTYITTHNGPLSYTTRDSIVRELYEIVEVITLELDIKLKETIRFIQQLPSAITTGLFP